jgi:hypothetical protein
MQPKNIVPDEKSDDFMKIFNNVNLGIYPLNDIQRTVGQLQAQYSDLFTLSLALYLLGHIDGVRSERKRRRGKVAVWIVNSKLDRFVKVNGFILQRTKVA